MKVLYAFQSVGLFVVDVRDVAIHHGIETESRHGFDAQFGGEVLAVAEHRVDADIQLVGNLFVHKSLGHQFQYFGLAGREVVVQILGLSVELFDKSFDTFEHGLLVFMDRQRRGKGFGSRFAMGGEQHDFAFAGQEEIAVCYQQVGLQNIGIELFGGVVEEAVGPVVERRSDVEVSLKQMLQSEVHQRVGCNDSDAHGVDLCFVPAGFQHGVGDGAQDAVANAVVLLDVFFEAVQGEDDSVT